MFARLIMTMTNTVDDRTVRSALSDRDSSSVLAAQINNKKEREGERGYKRFPFHGEDMQHRCCRENKSRQSLTSKTYLLSHVFTSIAISHFHLSYPLRPGAQRHNIVKIKIRIPDFFLIFTGVLILIYTLSLYHQRSQERRGIQTLDS